ncbi:complement C3-like [Eleutherodactylus coqui]|uniref:complement C3-like n=1 Tax=Eleutherodactylus coqui TaxID=57060 RepID=UPI003462B863
MERRVVCLLLLSGLIGSYAQTPCTLITPGILRADTKETIVLDGHNTGFEAEIRIQDFPQKKLLFAQGKISVNSNNDFLGTTSIEIKSQDLLHEVKKTYYVSVQVSSPQCTTEKVVLVSFHSGYIFIQTDKTIYTPGSKVLCRIYPRNYLMQQAKQRVILEIRNPDGMVTLQDPRSPDKFGIISKTYELSELAKIGTWNITAHYDNSHERFSAHFEVKEYVLPSFEVTITAEKSFMYLDAKTFSVTIESQYLYKKPVDGVAFVIFGVKKGDEKKSLTDSLRRIELVKGTTRPVQLLRKDLIKPFKNPEELLQYKLYVSVTVITDLGSDFVEAELDDIYIVNSPYKILFTKISKYFKPGMPFGLMVMVTNPDGSPANEIFLVANPGGIGAKTHQDGLARLRLNTDVNLKSLHITVRTAVPGLPDNLQASVETTVTAYKTPSTQYNYLHIGVTNTILEPRTQIFINFNILNSNVGVQNQINHFTYLILNKGQIMKAGKQSRKVGQSPITMSLFITEDFIPSFRIVAYYIVGGEIVSDSVWVDVVDKCMGTLTLEADNKIGKPQDPIKLTLKADYHSTVGLVAVDKGVFTLNSKYKLTQSKVWDVVEKSDIACTPGSGADNMGVFYDAGLAVKTNLGTTTTERSDSSCKGINRRKRSTSAALLEYKTEKASNYTSQEKQCCHDGMVSNPMGHSCERRARLIQDGDKCVEAFLDCCRFIKMKVEIEKYLKDNDDLDRSFSEDDYIPDGDILVRSDFPESWLWKIVQMEEKPNAKNISTKVLNIHLKDSITTWELLAVSLSENKGICVAEPYEIQAFKPMFIDLKLPYSAVRNEQVEIRAIIYNYQAKGIQVRVTLFYNPQLCSLSTAKKPHTVTVKVKENSSIVVPFVIVPLSIGGQEIEVKAAVYGDYVGDGVRKTLRVVPEGTRKTEIISSVILEPAARSGEHVVRVPALSNKNLVPDSPPTIIINVQGIPIAQFLEDAIDGASLSHLIVVPSGCVEQNMKKLTRVLIGTHYLDKTNQWHRIGVNRRDEAIQNINTGYVNSRSYRKKDGSFGSFSGSNSGTWLTAYVVKVFAIAKNVINIEDNILCDSVKWLISMRQKPDGMFNENIPISGQYMKGGLAGSSDPDVAMTAFVVISLLESQKYCTNFIDNLQISIDKAVNFIAENYKKLQKPHSVAITSYALALAGKLKDPEKLLSAAKDKTYWDTQNGFKAISIEATSYALLTLLKLDTSDAIDPVVRWLIEHRYYGEVQITTQSTIMLFQALAQYELAKPDRKTLDMNVAFKLPGRTEIKTHHINIENALQTRSESVGIFSLAIEKYNDDLETSDMTVVSLQTNTNGDFVVNANGRGQAALTVMAVYYEIETEMEKECNSFDLSVTVHKEPLVPKPDVLETMSINICFRHRKPVDATMSIIDVSMMTGFSPDETDLNKLKNGVDRYISLYEINKGAFDKGSLIIYLDRVSHTEQQCLKFNLNKYLNTGLTQPGSVKIYDYYSPESGCRKFYHYEEDNKLLGRICHDKVCQCAEGNCLMSQDTEKRSAVNRTVTACEYGMDHVYKTSLLDIHYGKDFDRYEMHIKEVYKTGTDANAKGNNRTFISHIKCRENLKFTKGKDYIVFGALKNVLHTETLGYYYILGRDTWMEWWPNERECQNKEYKKLCDDFYRVAEELEILGCQT